MTVHVTAEGTGVTSPVPLSPGATVADLLAVVAPDDPAITFTVRVNRSPVPPSHRLRPDDRVLLTRLPTPPRD